MKIDFEQVLTAYKNVKEPHKNHLFFQKLISTYDCFGEEKWNSRKPKPSPPIKERPKIGNQDVSPDNVYKKALILSLNKLTASNMDTVGTSIIKTYKICFNEIFVATIWEYFIRQPVFQDVYIKMIERLKNTVTETEDIWNSIYKSYISNDTWKINYELIEQSHNYDDFCEYIKEKKRLNAMAQGWSRLISSDIVIVTDPFKWCVKVVETCLSFDLSNVVYRTMVDSYVEQIREYSKYLQIQIPITLIDSVCELSKLNIQTSTKFKIEDFRIENKK